MCLSELSGLETLEASTLRARALLRLRKPSDALAAVSADHGDGNRDRGELSLLRAIANARLGNQIATYEGICAARVYSISSRDFTLEAEVDFYDGLLAFGEGHIEPARAACERALALLESPAACAQAVGRIPREHVVSRTQELLGVIDAAEGRYQDFLGHARAALETLDRCAIPDVFQEAYALKNLTILVRDFDLADDARRVAARVPSIAWTEDVARVEFATWEALGWCFALRGNGHQALRSFRSAERASSSIPEHVTISVDRALVAREFGHLAMVGEETEHALEMAASYNWNEAPDDTREALLSLAQIAAAIAPGRARAMFDRYTGIRNAMDGTFAARLEPRTRAEEAYTHGLVLRAEGRRDASIERLQTAFETWRGIGYEWRAARAALELAELEAGDVFRLAVHRELRQRPDSVFSTRARLVA